MGTMLSLFQSQTAIPGPNKRIIQLPMGRIRTLHKGFQMLSESFALNQKEFEQIFTYDESVFVLWDTDNNGLVDVIEFFCALAIFSTARIEDKIRFLFEFFDMNENNYLEEVDLQFLFTSCIGALSKTFSAFTTDEATREESFESLAKLTRTSFPDGMKVTVSDMLKWGTTSNEFKQFFTMVELYNQKNQI